MAVIVVLPDAPPGCKSFTPAALRTLCNLVRPAVPLGPSVLDCACISEPPFYIAGCFGILFWAARELLGAIMKLLFY